MGSKLKKKARLQMVPSGPVAVPPPPAPPLPRTVQQIQQEGLNLMSVIGSKYHQIRGLKKEIELLQEHGDKLNREGEASQAYYALEAAKAKQQEQPK